MSNLNRIKPIFSAALDKHGMDRQSYLDEACGEDADLKAQVVALLKAHEEAEDFLSEPAVGSDVTLDSEPLAEGRESVIDRYKLLEHIGEGGMAVVYMAEQERPIRRKVALKIIKPGMDTKSIMARFEAERQALAIMDHPNIAKVFDAGATDTGRPYFVMELVHGVSITEFCDQQKLPMQVRLALFSEVCNAVQHAHQRGIIHRDLKPSNIMVTMHDDQAVPKVIDFGIAKATNQRLTEKTMFTRYAQMIGTPAYMSPEQAQMSGLDIDTRSDIYSLGVLLYELLTGTAPFSDEQLREAGYLEMQRIITEEEPAKPSTRLSTLGDTITDIAKQRCCSADMLRKTLRGDLDWIVMKALEKNRTRRYETASSFKRDIHRYMKHEPVHARRPGTVYRLQKYLCRHRVHVIAALAAVFLMGAAITVVTMKYNDMRRQAEVEQIRRDQQERTDRAEDSKALQQVRESLAKGHHENAMAQVRQLLPSRHVGPEARLLYASILIYQTEDEAATAELEGLVNEKPEIASAAYSLLAELRRRNLSSNDVEGIKAIEDYMQKARDLFPDSAHACYLGALTALSTPEKLRMLDKAIERDRWHYEAWRLRALIYQASRRYEALRHDGTALTMLPEQKNGLGHALRATALTKLGKYEQALDEYERGIKLTSEQEAEYAELNAQRCHVLLLMGRHNDVIKEAQVLLDKIPPILELVRSRARLQFDLFCARTALGQYAPASRLYAQVMNSASNSRYDYLTRDYFEQWSRSYVFEILSKGQSWYPGDRAPSGKDYRIMREAEAQYRALNVKARRLTEGFAPAWSPDGRQLAFSLGVYGSSGIAIYDVKTGETTLLTVPGRDPSWSPDGQHIAFIRDRRVLRMESLTSVERERRGAFSRPGEIWIMNRDGTEGRSLGCRGWKLSWDSDSEHVNFWDSGVHYSISVRDKNAQPQRLQEKPNWCQSMFPSPDHSSDLYLDHKSLKIIDRGTSTPRRQWSNTPLLINANWAPSGRHISVGVFRTHWYRAGLWLFDLETGEAGQVFDGRVTSGVWSPDETKLAITLGYPFNEIWLADLDPNQSALEQLGPGLTIEAYHRQRIDYYTERIQSDPRDAECYLRRAECHNYLDEEEPFAADMESYVKIVWRSDMESPEERQTMDFLRRLWRATPRNLGPVVNSPDLENYVTTSGDGLSLFFSSSRPGGEGSLDLWVAKRYTIDDDWDTPRNLGAPVNTPYAEYAPSITEDGLSLYFCSNQGEPSDPVHIWVSTRDRTSNQWKTPTKLGPNVNRFGHHRAPSISGDGLELYVESMLFREEGQFDLWRTTRASEEDPWEPLEHLGLTVDSPWWDGEPSLSPDGLMLFYSHNEYSPQCVMGARNIWLTTRSSREAPWRTPVNLGPTINSGNWAQSACLSHDRSVFYFISDRDNGQGSWDIWEVKLSEAVASH